MSQINETAIRTPGVYTTEIPTLPPSVAQVSTAVPAFIGYTRIAINEIGDSLTNVPTKIFSIKEYEQYFGLAENEAGISVNVAITTDPVTSAVTSMTGQAVIASPSTHNMYYSLRHYFENGGGPCYIVSVGPTTNAVDAAELQLGLTALAAWDEPTLILFPEGQALAEAAYYGLIGQAIDQCALLQDRFTLVDVHHTLPLAATPNTTTTRSIRTLGTSKIKNSTALPKRVSDERPNSPCVIQFDAGPKKR